ncbi:MAG: TRAP transporter small permease [Alphaproteobacteria bacterium]|nr:TRAP transporter small permease [Alphaproteobacteria bacterium]
MDRDPSGDDRVHPVLYVVDTVLGALRQTCVVITGTALVVLTVIFGWLVYGRYVLNATPTWVEQVSLLLVVLITFLGAAVGIRDDTHLGVSYFKELCPPPVRRVFIVVSHLTLIAFGVVMMVHGYGLAAFKWEAPIPLIHVSEGLRVIPIAICGGLVALFSLGHLLTMALGRR